MISRVHFIIYLHPWREGDPPLYIINTCLIYKIYLKAELLHTKHVNRYKKPTFLTLMIINTFT